MYARVTMVQASVERLDEGIEAWKAGQSALVAHPGFRGNMLLVDRQTGKLLTVGLWETEADLQATMAQATSLREEVVRKALLLAPPTIEVYEVAARNEPRP